MLAPDSVSVPVPVLVSPNVPVVNAVVSLITPEKASLALFKLPVVKVALVVLSLVTVPAPPSEPMATELPFRLRIAPASTVTAELVPKALALPACKVPPLTWVAPV